MESFKTRKGMRITTNIRKISKFNQSNLGCRLSADIALFVISMRSRFLVKNVTLPGAHTLPTNIKTMSCTRVGSRVELMMFLLLKTFYCLCCCLIDSFMGWMGRCVVHKVSEHTYLFSASGLPRYVSSL